MKIIGISIANIRNTLPSKVIYTNIYLRTGLSEDNMPFIKLLRLIFNEQPVIHATVFKEVITMSLDVHLSEHGDDINCQELHDAIKELAALKGIGDFEYNVDCISGRKENYVSNVFRVAIKETDTNKSENNIIVKTLASPERQTLFQELHKREVMAYKNVIAQYKEMQTVLDEEKRLILSDCLYCNTEKLSEVIVLEDLTLKGFQIDSKLSHFEYLDYKQISAVISELAKFHVLSFVFKDKDPKKFETIKSDFYDILYSNKFLMQNKLRNYFFESFEMSLKLVTDLDAKKKLERVKDKILELLQLYTKPDDISVLCHGDCWANNMMFKCEDNEPTKVCFIDFQAMRYANPVTDIMYFLFVCTNSIFRLEHFEDLKDIYYASLNSFLSMYNIESEIVYPRENFNSDIDKYLPYGLLIAMIELRIVTMTPEDEVILKGGKILPEVLLTEVPGEIELFKLRVNDVVNETVKNGVLDKLVGEISI